MEGKQLNLTIDVQKESKTLNMAVIPGGKADEFTLIYLHDISNLKKLQDIQNKEIMTTIYSQNISHKMRSPLSTAINFSDLLLGQEPDPMKKRHL